MWIGQRLWRRTGRRRAAAFRRASPRICGAATMAMAAFKVVDTTTGEQRIVFAKATLGFFDFDWAPDS